MYRVIVALIPFMLGATVSLGQQITPLDTQKTPTRTEIQAMLQ